MEFTSCNLSLSKMPSVIIIKQLTGGLVMGKRQQLLCFSTFRQSELFCSGKETLTETELWDAERIKSGTQERWG